MSRLWAIDKSGPVSSACSLAQVKESRRGEAKDTALLSSRDRYILELTVWPKMSQVSCGVWREDSGLLSRPHSKRRPSSREDWGVLCVFSSCVFLMAEGRF